MADGWFPVLSPSGRRALRGSEVLSLDGQVIAGPPKGGIAGAWLDEDTILYRTHADPGELRLRSLVTGQDHQVGGPCSWVSSGGGIWAWCEAPSGGPVCIRTSDGRRWDGYGGGWAPVHVARDGSLFFGVHAGSGLFYVPSGAADPVLIDPAGGRLVRSCTRGIVYERDAHIVFADWATLEPRDITLPGEQEFGPVIVDTPDGPWLVTHTHTRLLARPLGSTTGVVVDESGDTFYPDAAWHVDRHEIRICWSKGIGPKGGSAGTPHEAWVALAAPRVDLSAPPVWHITGTEVDTLPFMAPDYSGTLRCPADGQTLQTVRTGPKEVTCLKGAPERQERWTWDDTAVCLTYDHSDGRAQPWRITPTPVWCRRVSFVGDSMVYGGTELIRRTATGGSTREPFPVKTSVYAYGEHIPIAGIGRCRILTTTWEPHYPASQYQERHWWAIRESDGLRLGRVRYEEWRHGVLERAFDFSELLPEVRLEPAAPLAIPDPVETPMPPEPPAMPEPTITDAEFANAGGRIEHRYARWGRPGREVHTDPLSYRWMVDYYVLRRAGRDHEAAVREVERRMDVAAGVAQPEPEPSPEPPVTPPANGLVGALRVA